MTERQSDKSGVFMSALIFLLFVAVVYLNFSDRFRDYIPIGDEPALLQGSLKYGPNQWMLSGYSKYFEIYPEWFVPYTNFIRPATNAIVWISGVIFESNYLFYILPYYFSIIFCVFMMFHIHRMMRINRYLFSIFLVFWLFSPAVSGPGLWNVPFIFDVVATAVVVSAFLCVLKERYVSGIILLTIAVFTKETALFAPFAAALTILAVRPLTSKRGWFAAAAMLPIILWMGVRQFAFGAVLGGTYASVGIMNLVKGLTVWPIGVSGVSMLLKTWRDGEGVIFNTSLALFYIILNFVVLFSVFIICYKIVSSFKSGAWFKFNRPDSEFERYFFAAILWFSLSTAYVVLLGVGGRFGSSAYFFLGIILAAAPKLYPGEAAGRLPVVALALLAATFLVSSLAAMEKDAASARDQSALAKSLYNALRRLPQDGEGVLIVNAPAAYSAPSSIEWVTQTSNEVHFLNQFEGCTHVEDGSAIAGVYAELQQIHVVIPKCAKIVFLGAKMPIAASSSDSVLTRGNFGSYRFNSVSNQKNAITGAQSVDFGSDFTFIPSRKFSHVIFYEWNESRYYSFQLNK